jgi:hypothetical protein
MSTTKHARLLARIAGVFYLMIFVSALFAYLHVRGQLIVSGDMARTATNIVAHEQLFRTGFAAAVICTMANLPLGFIFYELFKVVNPRLALLALVFIIASATLEAVNSLNYLAPLFPFTLPEYVKAFDDAQRQALARGAMRIFPYGFSVSLMFFGVFCALTGMLILKSKFLPWFLGVLMVAAGVCYEIDSLRLFLRWPDIPYLLRFTFVAEASLMLWLLILGVNEAKWRAQASAAAGG